MAEKLKHYEDGFTTTTEKDGGREQEAVVNTEPGEVHSPEILAKDVKEIVEEADRKQDEHLLENYYDKDEMDELYYDKTETNALLEEKQDVIDGDVESGTVASMLGLDSEGNLVKGSVPSGSVVDSELDIDSTNPVENKAIAQGFADVENGTRVAGKSLTAEQLENVSEESGSTQTSPFNFQATGTDDNTTETPTAPIAKHLELRGNTVAWNQLIRTPTTTSETVNGLTITNNNDGSITISGTANADTTISAGGITLPQNHKYLLKGCPSGGSGTTYYLIDVNYPYTKDIGNGVIYTYSYSWITGIQIKVLNGTNMGTGKVFKPQIFDLTLLGKEYDSVLAFNRDYPLPYYEYNAGELISCKCNKLITVGYNAFGGVLEVGALGASGETVTASNAFRSADFIKVVSGQTYTYDVANAGTNTISNYMLAEYDADKNFISRTVVYSNQNQFELSENTHFIKFSSYCSESAAITGVQIAFHLTWDSSRTGYEAYDKHEYALPNVELRSAGNVYDEITPDGTYIKRVGTKLNQTGAIGDTISFSDIKADTTNIVCNSGLLSEIGTLSGTTLTLTKAISGVDFFYELVEAVVDTTSTFTENIVVDDFGTMEFVSTLTAPIVPQGNQFFYPADYVLLIDDLNNYLNDNDIGVSGLALKKELLPKLPSTSEDGTYTLKAIKSGTTITYSWVLDE